MDDHSDEAATKLVSTRLPTDLHHELELAGSLVDTSLLAASVGMIMHVFLFEQNGYESHLNKKMLAPYPCRVRVPGRRRPETVLRAV